jgi:hypothetical protein
MTVFRHSTQYLTIKSDNFMFIEDDSLVFNVTIDGWSESAPHNKTGVGISFQFSGSATELSGFPEPMNLLILPDVHSERSYTLDFYHLAGYVPFVFQL